MRGHPESLGVTRLDQGELSRPVRVRAPAWVHERLKGLTAAEIGELLVQGLTEAAVRPSEATAPPPRLGLEGVTVLHVMSCTLPGGLKNKLRWSPDRYSVLESDLSSGLELRLDFTNGKTVWRTVKGKGIRKDTIDTLLRYGIITVSEQY